jgi:hypothetical protein
VQDVPFVQEYHEAYPFEAGGAANDVRAVAVDTNGAVWAATKAGLYVLQSGKWSQPSGVTTGPLYDLYVDREDRAWVGAWDGVYCVAEGAPRKEASVSGTGSRALIRLSGFSVAWERTLNFHGSKGEIRTADSSGRLETRTFNPARVRRERIPYHGILHGGGDKVILLDFAKAVRRESSEGLRIAAETSLEPHLVGFAIEKARVAGRVVEMDTFRREALASGAG